MINLEKLYYFREKIPNFIKKIFPKIIRRKINQKLFPYYFLLTDLNVLPNLSYNDEEYIDKQLDLIKNFDITKKQNSFMTCPHLLQLISMKYDQDDVFNFLDVGGEKIDFFLEMKKKFKNVRYYLYNLKTVTDVFNKIKLKFDYKDFNVISDSQDVFNQKYDFVNFGSSIQYFKNYESFLEQVMNNSEFIMFSGTTLYNSDKKDFNKHIVVKQINLLPTINYQYFFNRKYFYNIFFKKNYDLLFEKKNLTRDVNYDNFKIKFNSIEYEDFLFVKKKI